MRQSQGCGDTSPLRDCFAEFTLSIREELARTGSNNPKRVVLKKRERTVAQIPVPSPRSIQVVRRLLAYHLLPHYQVYPFVLWCLKVIIITKSASAIVVLQPRLPEIIGIWLSFGNDPTLRYHVRQ